MLADKSEDQRGFGCTFCFAGQADAALSKLEEHVQVARLVDESHFIVRLVRCNACGQGFVSIFCESVDWAGGEDPQSRVLLPLKPTEVETLRWRGEDLDLDLIRSWGNGRQHIRMDWPSNKPKRVMWSNGPLLIAPHD